MHITVFMASFSAIVKLDRVRTNGYMMRIVSGRGKANST